jgi:hypothetical protein
MAFTSFGERMWQPILQPLGDCLSGYDGQPPTFPVFIERTNKPEKCREFMRRAGFREIDVVTENLNCQYPGITA